MKAKGERGIWPRAACMVWSALDGKEVRPFSLIKGTLVSTRFSMIQAGEVRPRPSAGQSTESLRRRVEKWADVTAMRGLAWLVKRGEVWRLEGGYIRKPQQHNDADAHFLDLVVDTEQRLTLLRFFLQNRPGHEPWHGRKPAPPMLFRGLVAEQTRILRDQMTEVSAEIDRRTSRSAGGEASYELGPGRR
jgi:hypothetical protein